MGKKTDRRGQGATCHTASTTRPATRLWSSTWMGQPRRAATGGAAGRGASRISASAFIVPRLLRRLPALEPLLRLLDERVVDEALHVVVEALHALARNLLRVYQRLGDDLRCR